MLIRDAELAGQRRDVRIAHHRIAAIGTLPPQPGEPVLDARGGLLLPGLHDHHIHLAALAAARTSVACGPPCITDREALATALRRPGSGWLRGTGYHESVAGMLDAATIDTMVADRPVRIQHRSGRMWFLNSAALDRLLADHAAPPTLDRVTGRLFDADDWLRHALAGQPPAFAAVGRELARTGVTGLTDMSPANDATIARHFAAEAARGALPQRVMLAGRQSLTSDDMGPAMMLGPVKLHLHEADLPALDATAALVAAAHASGRAVAVHCATEVELIFALAAFTDAGTRAGDRIEHASVTPDHAVGTIARLRLAVVSQPHFIAERGDAYRADVEPDAVPLLYRLAAFADAGVPLAAGSDAPYGRPDPWAAMAAAVTRRTASGAIIGPAETLSPEAALDLYLRAPDDLARTRQITVGAPADLCLLDAPWSAIRSDLSARHVSTTVVAGRIVHQRIDEAPA